jgi:hypothetical protein
MRATSTGLVAPLKLEALAINLRRPPPGGWRLCSAPYLRSCFRVELSGEKNMTHRKRRIGRAARSHGSDPTRGSSQPGSYSLARHEPSPAAPEQPAAAPEPPPIPAPGEPCHAPVPAPAGSPDTGGRLLSQAISGGARLLEVAPGLEEIARLPGILLAGVLLIIGSTIVVIRMAVSIPKRIGRLALFGLPLIGVVAVIAVAVMNGHRAPLGRLSQSPVRQLLTVTDVGVGVISQTRAFNSWDELMHSGSIQLLTNSGQYAGAIPLIGDPRGVIRCGDSLFVTQNVGSRHVLSRINPQAGDSTVNYPYSQSDVGDLVCWQHKVWAAEPSEGILGIFNLNTLKPIYLDRILPFITSIAVGSIDNQWAVWVLDGKDGLLAGVSEVRGTFEKIAEFNIQRGATQMLYAGQQMRLLYAAAACLGSFDSNQQDVDAPTSLPAGTATMSASNGTIYLAGGKAVTIIDTGVGPNQIQVIRIRAASSLVGASEYGGVLIAADASGKVFSANPATQDALTLAPGKDRAHSCQL